MGSCDIAQYRRTQEELEEEYERRLNTEKVCPTCGSSECPSLKINPYLNRHPICPQRSICRLPK